MSLIAYIKENFGEELLKNLIAEMQSCAIGVFSTGGKLLRANDGMRYFMDCGDDLSNPGNMLVNPDLQQLSGLGTEGRIFEGLLTISNRRDVTYTLQAKVFRKEEKILVIGEADVRQLFDLNKEMSVLNQEINNLQLSLLKEKKTVQARSAELEQKNAVLKELNDEKNRFIGIAAHDLRNPISTALSFADLLATQPDMFPPEKHTEFLKMIVERCQFALHLVEDLLDASKIEAGIINLDLQEQDYIRFIKINIERNSNLTAKKSQPIRLETDLQEITLKFDARKMEQVVNNLISNASKYSPPGTEILVRIAKENGHIITRVIDHGQGIAPEELDLLFQPYQVTSTKSTANEKSTGLGLAIVKKIIQAHEGTIEVKSQPGEGSEFSFLLNRSTGTKRITSPNT